VPQYIVFRNERGYTEISVRAAVSVRHTRTYVRACVYVSTNNKASWKELSIRSLAPGGLPYAAYNFRAYDTRLLSVLYEAVKNVQRVSLSPVNWSCRFRRCPKRERAFFSFVTDNYISSAFFVREKLRENSRGYTDDDSTSLLRIILNFNEIHDHRGLF